PDEDGRILAEGRSDDRDRLVVVVDGRRVERRQQPSHDPHGPRDHAQEPEREPQPEEPFLVSREGDAGELPCDAVHGRNAFAQTSIDGRQEIAGARRLSRRRSTTQVLRRPRPDGSRERATDAFRGHVRRHARRGGCPGTWATRRAANRTMLTPTAISTWTLRYTI